MIITHKFKIDDVEHICHLRSKLFGELVVYWDGGSVTIPWDTYKGKIITLDDLKIVMEIAKLHGENYFQQLNDLQEIINGAMV